MRKALLVAFVLALCAIALAFIYDPSLGSYAVAVAGWFQRKGHDGIMLYGALDIIATVLLFPGTPFTLGAGFLYGTVLGSAVVSIASTAAATIAFLLARYVAGDWLARRPTKYAVLRSLDQSIADHGFKMVLLMRLQPVFIPFAYLNMGLGLTSVRLRDYVAGSWLGMLPGTILYVYAGSLLNVAYFGRFNFRSILTHPSSRMHTFSLLLGGAAFFALCFLISRIARSSLQRMQQPAIGEDPGLLRSPKSMQPLEADPSAKKG
jgi:uncharacterized membrane protein YdjX (TVP38/TMEM64 family)